jgi:glycosyltransferase involved in cell wall biosynthesis
VPRAAPLDRMPISGKPEAMRIGVFVDPALDEKPTGIGRHVLCLLEALAEIDRQNEYLLYYPARKDDGREVFPGQAKRPNFRPRSVSFPAGWLYRNPRLWWNWRLPAALRRDRVDVFHGPNHFLPRYAKAPGVVTIHDLAYFHMGVHGPHIDESLRRWTRLALAQAARVIALSEHTAADVRELGFDADRIRVIYGGGNLAPEESIAADRIEELKKTLDLPGRYVLFLGAIQPRKNVPLLVRAFAQLRKEGAIQQRLVLAGPLDSAAEETRRLAADLGVSEDVRFTGYLEPWQVPLIYRLADAFVLPSRYEGFGMVAIEAMHYGAPCIVADTSCLREVTSDAALHAGVETPEELASVMKRLLASEPLRADLIRRGKERAKLFTWRRNAEQTLSVYQELHREAARPQASMSRAAP